jgi:hypothetical protein
MKVIVCLLITLVMLVSGCASLDPRKNSTYSITVQTFDKKQGIGPLLTSATLTYCGPTPFFVEPHASIEATSQTVTANLGTDSKRATSMISRIVYFVSGAFVQWLGFFGGAK